MQYFIAGWGDRYTDAMSPSWVANEWFMMNYSVFTYEYCDVID